MDQERRTVSAQGKLQEADQHRVNGQYDEAVALYEEILADQSDHFEAHMGLGLVYGFNGLFDESIEELKRASRLRPDLADAWLNLGKTYAMLGMYEEARPTLEKTLQLDPENGEATKQLQFLKEFGF